MGENKLPEPYPVRDSGATSPFSIRCRVIDECVAVISDPESFAKAAAANEQLVAGAGLAIREKVSRAFEAEGGCPAFGGFLKAGYHSSVICGLVGVQLHSYVQLKLCEKGRNVYCPIWKARGSNDP